MNVGLKFAAAKKPDGGCVFSSSTARTVQRKMRFHLCALHTFCADVHLAIIAEQDLSVSSLTYLKLSDASMITASDFSFDCSAVRK